MVLAGLKLAGISAENVFGGGAVKRAGARVADEN